ncbi:MAG: hypothetical protein U9Q99_02265 [Nanoarchaeota archaeon]|nr:hypothetical protein [Nanoarchaeota archaeon]
MIAWIFMILDLITLTTITLVNFEMNIIFYLPTMSFIYLVGKAIIFKDGMSIIDGISGIYILIAWLFNINHSSIYWVILAWFAYKLMFTIVFSAGNN